MANKLVLELLADTNNLLKGLEQAQRSVGNFVDASRTAGASLGGGVNRALDAFADLASGGAKAGGVLAGALVAAGTAAVMLTVSVGKQVEAIDQLSQKTGIATQTIQGWSVIMAENGFQAESLTAGMRTLAKQIVEARNPASAAASTFDEMGISITALGSTDTTLRALADHFKALPDGPDKARLAVSLFGKAGLDMIPMLNRGSAAFEQSRLAAEQFGAVLTGSQLTALNKVDDAMDRMGVALTGLKMQLAATFAGSVQTGIEAVTAGIAKLTSITTNYSAALEQIKKDHPIIFSTMPGIASAMAAAKAASMPPPAPPVPTGPQDTHVAEFAVAQAEKQEQLGQRIRDQLIEKYRLLVSEQHAQESLGKVVLQIIQRETSARNEAFALQLQQAEDVNNLQFQKPSSSTLFDDHLKAVQALMALIPELTFQEASLLAVQNAENGQAVIDASRERLRTLESTAQALSVQADTEQAYADHAASAYQRLGPLFGDYATARQYEMDAIDARLAAGTAKLDDELAKQLISQEEYHQKVLQLDLQADARRQGLADKFPSFMEKQLKDLVGSNSFSMAQISSTWTSGIANMIVHGGNLKAAWQSTQTALLQATLNTGVQMLAQGALLAARELGLLSATEAAKLGLRTASEASQTGVKVAGDAARVTSDVTANAAIVGTNAVSATTVTGFWAGAGAAIVGTFGAITGAIAGFWTATLVPMFTAVGTALIGFLSSIATALTATVFGIPFAGGILLAVGGIVAALAALGTLKFAKGGIVTGPTLGMIGEAGSKEAVIPLNGRGASFMQSIMGNTGGGSYQQTIMLDGRVLARSISDQLPSVLRMGGVPA